MKPSDVDVDLPSVGGVDLDYLYAAFPLFFQIMSWIALAAIVLGVLSLLFLMVAARAQSARERRRAKRDPNEADYLWVFLVPALDEEVTIADSISRLEQVEVTHRCILVIDDGSADRTGEILAELAARSPELVVLTRTTPQARQGKAAALNAAWTYLHGTVLAAGSRFAGWDPRQVIVTVVDADGRLSPNVGQAVVHFADPRVGGVQALVTIYNRRSFLTWAQDMEFAVFGHVFQRGRSAMGTANMGGNGQLNRLAALDSVAASTWRRTPTPANATPAGHAKEPRALIGPHGPWRDRLTEDQDLGVRLLNSGWRSEQSLEITVAQQGLNSLRRLYRQRTRWSQGSWQALSLLFTSRRPGAPRGQAHLDQMWYLITPLVQAYVGLQLVLGWIFDFTLDIDLSRWPLILLVLFYVFSFGPGLVGILASQGGRGVRRLIIALLLAHLYVLYSWIIYPVVYRAAGRLILRRGAWAKTARESVVDDDARAAAGT